MPKILAIDYGIKRTGLAETDESQIFAFGLETIETGKLAVYLKDYLSRNKIQKIIVGEPKRMNNEASSISTEIEKFILSLQKNYPSLEIVRVDERFTSKMAFQTMIDGGLGKAKRRDKSLVDKIAATIILQSYLDSVR